MSHQIYIQTHLDFPSTKPQMILEGTLQKVKKPIKKTIVSKRNRFGIKNVISVPENGRFSDNLGYLGSQLHSNTVLISSRQAGRM